MVLYAIAEATLFVLFAIIAAIVLTVVGSLFIRFVRRYWRTITTIIVCALIVAVVLGTLHGVARAEERRVEVVDFDFFSAEVVFEDEDGFLWTCPFGKFGWSIGEEYVLILSETETSIEEVE